MDILKTLQQASKRPRTALTLAPLGEFAVLGALLLGLQHGYKVVGAHSSNVAPAAIAVQVSNITNIEIDSLVDKINGIGQTTDTVASRGLAPLGRVLPNTFETKANTAPTKFQFSFSNPQAWLKATADNPFASEKNEDSGLAIWQINAKFAFATSIKEAQAKSKAYDKQKFVIMLDPGHGGTDPGSIGHNGLKEKLLTLDIAQRAERLLSKNKDIQVVLTRNSDTGMSRKNRVEKVKRSNADMVVSLHLNHLPQTDVNLVETFYAAPHNILESLEKQRSGEKPNGLVKTTAALNPDLAFTQGSKQLASLMQRRVFEEVIDSNPNTDNAGVKEDTLYILTRSFTPGVLIELSCLSNVQEAERLTDAAYRQRLAAALAKGISEYLDTPAAKREFGPEV